MARTFPTIQKEEIESYARFCAVHNIIADGSPDDKHNADLVVQYFTQTWVNDLTDQTLEQAFPALQPHLKFESAARTEARRVAATFHDVDGLSAWFDTQTILVNSGDAGFYNITEIMLELQGRPVTQASITAAIQSIENATRGGGTVGQFSTRKRKPLIYVERKQERTKSFHELTDDGKNTFTTSGMVRTADGGWRSKTHREQMRDQEAAEAAKNSTPKAKGPVDAWQTLCEDLLKFGTHSAQQNLRETFDRGIAQGKEFRQIYGEMETLKRSYLRLLPTAKY